MSGNDKFSIKEAIIGVVLLGLIAGAMFFTIRAFNTEGEKNAVTISDLGDAEPDHVETTVKIVSIDAIKGDVTARFEFAPSGTLLSPDGTLKQDLRVFVNSSNAKQETDFGKGKRMAPVEGVFNMHEGNATEYPFDKYLAEIDVYVVKSKPAEKKKPEPAPAPAAVKTSETEKTADEKKEDEEEEDSNEIPLSVDFEGSISGYNIAATRASYSDDSYVGIEARIERAGTVKFFSLFVAGLMWVLSTGVLFLMMSVIVRGRKVELAMFSFMATLLFAFYAVRNSQPNVPPIGVFSDFIAFFWVEGIVATCLVVGLVTWLFRSTK